MISSSFPGLSQISINPSDTICKPVKELKVIYTAARMYKYTDSLLKISEAQLGELKNKVSLLEEKDVESKAECRRQMDYLSNQISVYVEQVKGYETLLKKERRKRRLITGAGITLTGGLLYLLITK